MLTGQSDCLRLRASSHCGRDDRLLGMDCGHHRDYTLLPATPQELVFSHMLYTTRGVSREVDTTHILDGTTFERTDRRTADSLDFAMQTQEVLFNNDRLYSHNYTTKSIWCPISLRQSLTTYPADVTTLLPASSDQRRRSRFNATPPSPQSSAPPEGALQRTQPALSRADHRLHHRH